MSRQLFCLKFYRFLRIIKSAYWESENFVQSNLQIALETGMYTTEVRLKKNHFVEMHSQIWLELKDLGLSPGVSFFLQGVKVTKTQGFFSFNVACKWKRKILGVAPEEGWFILTNLDTLELAIAAYKRRFDIEEMFLNLMERWL